MANNNYWLKLDKDFFKSANIQVLESQPNGKEYCLFYLKLMCESIQFNGELRFNEVVPYDDNMLATITNTNIDIVRNACKALYSLGLIKVLTNGTLFLEQVNKLLTKGKDKEREIKEIDTNKDIKLELEIEEKETYNKEKDSYTNPVENIIAPEERFTEQEITDYITLKGYNIKPKEFYNYYKSLGWKIGNTIIRDIKPLIDNWGYKRMIESRNAELNKQAAAQAPIQQREVGTFKFGENIVSDEDL